MYLQASHKIEPHEQSIFSRTAFACTNQPIVTLVVNWCLIKIPVCGGVVCVGVGGGVEVGRTTDVELPSGEPVED